MPWDKEVIIDASLRVSRGSKVKKEIQAKVTEENKTFDVECVSLSTLIAVILGACVYRRSMDRSLVMPQTKGMDFQP